MPKQRTFIDFKVIWKNIHRMVISDSEDKLLQNWLEEGPAHQEFYEQAQRFYAEGSHFRDHKGLKKAWKNVQRKTRNAKGKVVRFATVASGVAAGILLFAVVFYLTNKSSEPAGVTGNVCIKPGTDKAVLTLSDGSQHNLPSEKSFVLIEGHCMLRSKGGKLEYAQSGKEVSEIMYNRLKTPRGGEFFLQLSDGTKVWLNSGSSLRYPVQFSGNERKVELTGEAYFEVAKDGHSPFLIMSGEQVVKVLGTQLNITSYTESKFIFTTLIEGKVEIFEKNNPENKCMLTPGRQSVFSKKDLLVSSRKVDPSKFVAWKDGRFEFDDESLVCIMRTLSRWYDVEVVFANTDRKNTRFTGNLQRSATIQEILGKIEKTEEVKFRINDKTVIVE
jgi:ferric-dicitrate binding protein FerR (iron transport regulator)